MSTLREPTVTLPESSPLTRSAAYQIADYLDQLGVEVVFGLCGHTVIAMLDALGKSRIRFVTTRHEQSAAHAADGYARATGKPGVVLSHLGPGLTNAATGVANAALDSIPMVVIAGDVQSYFHGRHPHQEINLHHDASQIEIYRPFCKRVYRVDRVADLRAFSNGRSTCRRPAGRTRLGRADGRLFSRSGSWRLPEDAVTDRQTDARSGGRAAHCRRLAWPIGRCCMPAGGALARATRRSSPRSPKRSTFRWPIR
jgi:hypothetical protein